MRTGMSGHGGRLPRLSYRSGHAPRTVLDFPQGLDARESHQDRHGAQTELPPAAPRARSDRSPAAAGDSSLGPAALRRAHRDQAADGLHPRSQVRPPHDEPEGALAAFYGRRPRAHAERAVSAEDRGASDWTAAAPRPD